MTKKNELDLTPLGLRLALAAGASALALGTANAWAQDDQDDDIELIEESDDVEETEDEIVVTGSRIRRSTFTSISPLQVISADDALDVGLVDPSAILQQSEAAAGQQIDSTFQGFVLDNGPGSETLNLRGLGASRTLVLINGRRFAPIGVEGAPTQPSINLIPGSLVERYDLLLDGASSIYGSDAVAGVGNVVLKKDFDGFEVFASGDYAQEGAGHDFTISGAWGKNTDRGFFGIGVEYDYQDEVTYADRKFLSGCETNYQITEDGDIRTVDIRTNFETLRDTQGLIGAPTSPCVSGAGGFANRIFERGSVAFGSAYYTPGNGNILDDFSDTGLFSVPIDADRDGIADIYFPFFSPGSRDIEESFFNEQKQISGMAYGEYTFDGEMNLTPFFEAFYVNNNISANSGQGVLFPDLPAGNPFNVCNPDAEGGVDCGLAEDALLQSDHYIDAFQSYYNGGGGSANCFGLPAAACLPATFGLLNGELGAIPISPQIQVRDDRSLVDVELEQIRFVGGIRGDLPFMNRGSFADWNFEGSFLYSKSNGVSARPGIRDDRLALAIGYDPTTDLDGEDGNGDGIPDGNTNDGTDPLGEGGLLELPGGPCDIAGVSNPDLLQADAAAGCVPVNLLAPSLFNTTNGEFATQAERDYLFDSRDFDTEYEQYVFNAFVGGTLTELPAGPLSAVVGVEYRNDKIVSTPDNVAADGLFFGFFSDLGAEGEKWTREAFAEVDIPVLGGKPLARELSVNASTRWTEDEFYGSAWTYSLKAGWRPFDPLLLKASFGTSFRAPNLRENFIRGTSGFNTVFDPCAVPDEAIALSGDGTFVYNPTEDDRLENNPEVFENCRREGRNPETIGFDPISGQGGQGAGVEITTGGSEDVGPETSESFTAGFAFEQPWFDSFDASLNVSYYDIEIEDSIVEPNAQFLVNSCFFRTEPGRSVFCDAVSAPGPNALLSDINASFINQDKETVTGLDYNARFAYEFDAFDEPMTFRLNLRANQLKERDTIFIGDDLTVDLDQDAGEFGFPEWTGTATASLDVSDYRFTWVTRMVGEVSQRANFDDVQEASVNVFRDGITCLPETGDVQCRDVDFADDWYTHTASIRYRGDTMIIRAGIQNVFDNEPPLVSGNQVFSISNVPLGNPYDFNGRQYFLSVSKEF